MKSRALVLLLAGTWIASSAFAGTPSPIPATATTVTTGSSSRTDTRGYVGLNWTLGGSLTPALVLGVSNMRVKSNGDTSGARLAFHVNLLGGVAPGLVKLSYLNGKEDIQGEIGAGYNFVKAAPLLGLGVNAPYLSAGIDGYLTREFSPYLGLNSQGKYDKPNRSSTTSYSCPAGFELSGTTCVFMPD